MAGSAADTPTTPETFRVSDVDREQAVDKLKAEYADGRLSHETFMLRMQAALDARNEGQLSGLFADLPPSQGRLDRMRAAVRSWGHNARGALEEAADTVRGMVPRRGYPGSGLRGDTWRDGADYTELESPAYLRPADPEQLVFPPGPDISFTIGRDQRCDLYLGDMSVSRLHAKLVRDAEGWFLTDVGSTNGTRLNGWRVRAAVRVRPGDHVTFGSVSFVLCDPGGRPPESPRESEGGGTG
jgi:hypothetical protein